MLVSVRYKKELEWVQIGNIINNFEVIDILEDSLVSINLGKDSSNEPFYFSKKTGICLSDNNISELNIFIKTFQLHNEEGLSLEKIYELFHFLEHLCKFKEIFSFELRRFKGGRLTENFYIISSDLDFKITHLGASVGLNIEVPCGCPFVIDNTTYSYNKTMMLYSSIIHCDSVQELMEINIDTKNIPTTLIEDIKETLEWYNKFNSDSCGN